MNVTDPILRVSVVSTGQVQIRPDHEASTWRPAAWWLLASRRLTGSRPINAYVIQHRDGLVLSSPLPQMRGLMRRHIDLPAPALAPDRARTHR
jgi:hypothetical protein